MKQSRIRSSALLVLLSLALGAPDAMASFFGKSELSSPWKERFQDVNKLNEFTQKGLPTEISDAIIKDYELVGAQFNNATFRDVEWNNTSIEGMTINNGRFIGNTFNGAYFNEAKLTNVTFEDSEFNNVYFHSAQLNGVKFIHCKFTAGSEANLRFLKNSSIEFEFTTFEAEDKGLSKIIFAGSSANLTFRNSTLTKVRLIDLALPSTLTFEKSKLEGVEWSRSQLAKLVMDGVTGGGHSGANGGDIAETEIRNSSVRFGLNEGTFGKINFVNSKIESTFNSANIKELQISNCKGMEKLITFKSKIDTLQIINCPINNMRPLEATIQNFSINDATIVNSDFGDMKAKHFTLTNVTLDKKIDFTGAQVEHLITKNLTKGSGLNLNLTGSNVKF